jgi:hypothetical protein
VVEWEQSSAVRLVKSLQAAIEVTRAMLKAMNTVNSNRNSSHWVWRERVHPQQEGEEETNIRIVIITSC